MDITIGKIFMRNSLIFITFLLLFSGCVPVYQIDYHPLDYTPIDTEPIIHIRPGIEYVYIPRYRPRPLYFYAGRWYDEPHTHIIYRDIRGRISPKKIPKRIMEDIERRMKRNRPPAIPYKHRMKIRKRTKRHGRV